MIRQRGIDILTGQDFGQKRDRPLALTRQFRIKISMEITQPAAAEKPRSGFEVQATQWPLLTGLVKFH